MDKDWAMGDHCTCNQSSCHQAPQPQDPEASVVTFMVGSLDGKGRNETVPEREELLSPCQVGPKASVQAD